jgi:hypothetical protein
MGAAIKWNPAIGTGFGLVLEPSLVGLACILAFVVRLVVRASRCAYGSVGMRCPTRLAELVDAIAREAIGRKVARVRITRRVRASHRSRVDGETDHAYDSYASRVVATEGWAYNRPALRSAFYRKETDDDGGFDRSGWPSPETV